MKKWKLVTIISSIVILATSSGVTLWYSDFKGMLETYPDAKYVVVDNPLYKMHILTRNEEGFARWKIVKEKWNTFYDNRYIAGQFTWEVEYYRTYGEDKWFKLIPKRTLVKVELDYPTESRLENPTDEAENYVIIRKSTPYYASGRSGSGGTLIEEYILPYDSTSSTKINVIFEPNEVSPNRTKNLHRITMRFKDVRGEAEYWNNHLLFGDVQFSFEDAKDKIEFTYPDEPDIPVFIHYYSDITNEYSIRFKPMQGERIEIDPIIRIGEVAITYKLQRTPLAGVFYTPTCLRDCWLVFNKSVNKNVPIDSWNDFQFIIKKAKGAFDLESITPYLLRNVTENITIPEREKCNPIEFTSPNGTVIIIGEDCITIPEKTIETWRHRWVEISPPFTIQKDKVYSIAIYGIKTPKLGENSIDLKPKIKGIEIPFAWWDANWLNYKNITITASSEHDHINDYFQYNMSGLTFGTNNCSEELRMIDGVAGTETDFILVDDSGQAIGDGDEWCIPGWNYTVLKNTNKNVTVYYNYATATIPSYVDEDLGFGTKWMGALDTAFEAATWTRVDGGATWANITIPEEGNWWGIKLTMADGADKYQLVEAAALNSTWVIRFNTSNTQGTGADGSIRIGTGSGAGTDYYDGWCPTADKWMREATRPGVVYGSSDMKTIQTYKMTFNYSTQNATIWVYNQSDGSSVTVATDTITLEASVDNFFIGDNSPGGDTNPVYYFSFVGLSFEGSYPPLDLLLGPEESPPVVGDVTAPLWRNQTSQDADDTIKVNESIVLAAQGFDETSLHYGILSENSSGNFVNHTTDILYNNSDTYGRINYECMADGVGFSASYSCEHAFDGNKTTWVQCSAIGWCYMNATYENPIPFTSNISLNSKIGGNDDLQIYCWNYTGSGWTTLYTTGAAPADPTDLSWVIHESCVDDNVIINITMARGGATVAKYYDGNLTWNATVNATNTWEWTNSTWRNSSIGESLNMTVNWTYYYNDTSGNENATPLKTFTIAGDALPQWSRNESNISTVYFNNISKFNISWIEGIHAIDTVVIETNLTGSAANYSMVTLGNNIWHWNETFGAGGYYWNSTANDTSGFGNVSDTWFFDVAKGTDVVTLYLNGTSADKYFESNEPVNFTCTASASGACTLTINNSVLGLDFGTNEYNWLNALSGINQLNNTLNYSINVTFGSAGNETLTIRLHSEDRLYENITLNFTRHKNGANYPSNVKIYLNGTLLSDIPNVTTNVYKADSQANFLTGTSHTFNYSFYYATSITAANLNVSALNYTCDVGVEDDSEDSWNCLADAGTCEAGSKGQAVDENWGTYWQQCYYLGGNAYYMYENYTIPDSTYAGNITVKYSTDPTSASITYQYYSGGWNTITGLSGLTTGGLGTTNTKTVVLPAAAFGALEENQLRLRAYGSVTNKCFRYYEGKVEIFNTTCNATRYPFQRLGFSKYDNEPK